jgi:hypothetical protein
MQKGVSQLSFCAVETQKIAVDSAWGACGSFPHREWRGEETANCRTIPMGHYRPPMVKTILVNGHRTGSIGLRWHGRRRR